ncbi:hypothetical protein AURDEDRAFT_173497 [Auricularia subglabra TFB-10046 SS5]|nr:hypothetical protein AURDEDRAFT_173497 [Auricularia subglabra TFB-10046 SS5]
MHLAPEPGTCYASIALPPCRICSGLELFGRTTSIGSHARASKTCAPQTRPRAKPVASVPPGGRGLVAAPSSSLVEASTGSCTPPSEDTRSHARQLSAGAKFAWIHKCSVQIASDVPTSCLKKIQQCAVVCLREDEPDIAAIKASFAENCPALADCCAANLSASFDE